MWRYILTGDDTTPAPGVETVLILGGAMSTAETSWRLITSLEPTYRVLAPAYAVHDDVGSFLDGLVRLLDLEGLQCVHVYGHSLGAGVAHVLVRRHPQRVDKLALSDAADAWGRGDFSATIEDPAPDEIGQLAAQLNLMADQVQSLVHTREQLAMLEERNRLARDLHDSVKQQVFAATMTLGAAQALWEQDPEAAREKVDEAFSLARSAQQDLTALIEELRPAVLDGRGLAPALEELAARWSRRTNIEVVVEARHLGSLPGELEEALYRVGQEALANVAKHSAASRVQISLARDGDGIVLTVADNGVGFEVEAAEGQGHGLRSMRERVAALDGDFTIDAGDSGTTVRARVPLQAPRP